MGKSNFPDNLTSEQMMKLTAQVLDDDPIFAAETIAVHYLSSIEICETILELVDIYKKEPIPQNRPMLDMLVRDLKRLHAADLGVELNFSQINKG